MQRRRCVGIAVAAAAGARVRRACTAQPLAASLSCTRHGQVCLPLRRCAAATLLCSVRPVSTPPSTTTTTRDVSDSGADTTATAAADVSLDFDFDPMASVRHDAAVQTAAQRRETVARQLLPGPPLLPHPPPASAVARVCAHLEQHPVDELIVHARVQVTHVQRASDGVEERVTARAPCALHEALTFARQQQMHLVQMGTNDDVAFCRVRDERVWVRKLVQAEVDAYAATMAADDAATTTQQQQQHAAAMTPDDTHSAAAATRTRGGGGGKPRPLIDHAFRDAVDAHFVGWRSKKICQDLRKGHPVKLTVRDFCSPEAALQKLREMCDALKAHAEATQVYHHYTSITANEREASVTLSPATANKSGTLSKAVRHPSDKDWAHAQARMDAACAKAGRASTYVKSNKLKPRNLGATLYRVDKYGRRID